MHKIVNTKTKQIYFISYYPISVKSERLRKIRAAGGIHKNAVIVKCA